MTAENAAAPDGTSNDGARGAEKKEAFFRAVEEKI